MKKKLLMTIFVFGCCLLTACGGNADTKTPDESKTVQNESAESSSDDTERSHQEKDFVGDDYSDTGEGTFHLVNESGTTENGNVIVVYADADMMLMQIGYDTVGINGGSLSHLYIDGMLSAKEQLGESQGSLDLSGDALSVGTHKVELVQFEGDSPDAAVTTYKSASYEVKEK